MRTRTELFALLPLVSTLPLFAQAPDVADAPSTALSKDAAAIVAASREQVIGR